MMRDADEYLREHIPTYAQLAPLSHGEQDVARQPASGTDYFSLSVRVEREPAAMQQNLGHCR